MDTDVLRWFKLVAEGVTVTEVSELEMVTQSGISRALARLEAQVGTPLLERSGRTLRLTRTGEVFKPHVDRLLAELRGGLDAVAQFVSPETGTVAVAFPQSLGSWLVPDLLGSFRAAHPGVAFRLTNARDELHGLPLDGGAADLEIGTRRFRTGPEATRPGDLAVRTQRIGNEPLRLALPATHPLARRAAQPAGPVTVLSGSAMPGHPAGGGRPRAVHRPAAHISAAQAGRRPVRGSGLPPQDRLRGRRPVQRPRPGDSGPRRRHRPRPARRLPGRRPGPVLYLPILDDGADRDIYLTWPADKPLLPAADLFRRHVIDTIGAGRIRPVSG